jgi:putative transposase
LGLQLRNKTPKRRVKVKLREDHAPAIRTNDVWAMDFVHDQLATGQKLGSMPGLTDKKAAAMSFA